MNRVAADATPLSLSRRMGVFERHLSLWVALCILVGTGLGHAFPGVFATLGSAEMAKVNLPVAVLVWLMIIPMLLKIDFGAMRQVRQHWRGIGVTVFVNWAVKPFSMALLAWIFIRHVFAPYLPAEQLDSYIAGLILLAAAPCTAMVFVWSNLCDGDPQFTLGQVALNDLIMVVAFAPIVGLLLGISSITVPWSTLMLSVGLYIIVPVIVAVLWRRRVIAGGGQAALDRLLQRLGPVSLVALLLTLGAAVRLPGRTDCRASPDYRDARGADPGPGLFQLGAVLPAQPQARRGALRGRPIGPDRRQQFLRTRGGDGRCGVRRALRRGTGDGGGRAGRSAGDAFRGAYRQCQQDLVRSARLIARALFEFPL
jgi:arsenical-resistance protein